MFPPSLNPDERQILRGGFGGVAWIYTGVVAVGLAATIVLTPLALWFWLRSSRFVLTDRRLVVKPRIGKARELTMEQLQGAKVTIGTATGSIFIDGPAKVRLRYQRNPEHAWGALLLMCQWPMPQPGPLRGAQCALCVTTTRRGGQVQQAGAGAICGDQVAFLPFTSGLRSGDIGKTAALAAVGVR